MFWTLFAFSSIVFLLPYLAVFPAFLKLRRMDPSIRRPFKVPGGLGVAAVIAVVCEIFILQSILFFVWVPGEPVDWAYAGPVLAGVIVTIVSGEVLVRWSKRTTEVRVREMKHVQNH